MQREKKRTVEVTKLNNDLSKPTQSMKYNKKDRKVLLSQVICSQYSMALKTRTQRTEELKFLLVIEDDPTKKKNVLKKLHSFLEFELEPINLCDTSSDEDEEGLVPVCAVTQNSLKCESSSREKRNRLPGKIEKWTRSPMKENMRRKNATM